VGTIHPKKLLRMLKKLGWYELRQVGSHLILKNDKLNLTTTIPMHPRDISTDTYNKILKQTGLKK
jgi:ycfA family protein